MGRLQAEEMRRFLEEDTALEWHLQYNHYPPFSLALKPVARQALDNARAGEWDKKITLPAGITHRVYGTEVPTRAVIEHFHLDTFLTQEDE